MVEVALVLVVAVMCVCVWGGIGGGGGGVVLDDIGGDRGCSDDIIETVRNRVTKILSVMLERNQLVLSLWSTLYSRCDESSM